MNVNDIHMRIDGLGRWTLHFAMLKLDEPIELHSDTREDPAKMEMRITLPLPEHIFKALDNTPKSDGPFKIYFNGEIKREM